MSEMLPLEVLRAGYREELRLAQEGRQAKLRELVSAFNPIAAAINELVDRCTRFPLTDARGSGTRWRKASIYNGSQMHHRIRLMERCPDGAVQYSFYYADGNTQWRVVVGPSEMTGKIHFMVTANAKEGPQYYQRAEQVIENLFNIVVRYEALPDDAPELQYG